MRKSARFRFLLLILAVVALIGALFLLDRIREHPEYAPMYSEGNAAPIARAV